jgi:hypothetical protein
MVSKIGHQPTPNNGRQNIGHKIGRCPQLAVICYPRSKFRIYKNSRTPFFQNVSRYLLTVWNVSKRHLTLQFPLKTPENMSQLWCHISKFWPHFLILTFTFVGEQLRSRVKKICESLRASIYPCPENPQERREVAMGVMTRIQDLEQVLNTTNEQRNRILAQVARNIRVWFIKVRKVAAIYHTLNCFSVDLGQKCLIGEIWCPVSEIDRRVFYFSKFWE